MTAHRILVCGATGELGRAITRRLLELTHGARTDHSAG